MKKLFLIIMVVAAAALVFWRWSSRQISPEEPSNTSDINNELQNLDLNNLDQEFEQIDKDLNSL